MSYREKSIWASLIIALIILANYLMDVINFANAGTLTPETLQSLFYKVILWTVILEIASQTAIAIIDHKQADQGDDERDKLIKLKASNIAYNLLGSAIYIAIFFIWLSHAKPEKMDNPFILSTVPNIYSVFNILLVGFLIAEVSKYATQVFYYRRGF